MNELELEQMMNRIVASVANAAAPPGLADRLKMQSMMPGPAADILQFRSVENLGRSETRKTVWGALVLHAAVLALLMVQLRAMQARTHAPDFVQTEVVLPPPHLPPSLKATGGGGGQVGPAPVTQGNPPRFAEKQLMPPRIHPFDARLTLVPTVDTPPMLMAKTELPNIGMPSSPNVGASVGNGRGGGLGSGDGNGVGPGTGGGMGGGLHHIGGSVMAPVLVYEPQAEFSEEARKSRVSGNVLVYFIVDEHGRPTHLRVVKGLGMGLDEKALEAVARYKFQPARENGQPVAVDIQVEVNFTIF